MSAVSEAITDELLALLTDSLERERQLGRADRLQVQTAASTHLRQTWEAGWALKRAHEEALTRLLASAVHPAAPDVTPPATLPSPREMLSWAYDQERLLALQYRDSARLAGHPETEKVLARLEDEQQRILDRVRVTYRDYSAA
ncbi:MAG TPA: hypothetical protein VFN94_10710 [Nitrospiria bacterium]|nr:hypothetical protein [Nitrospiria bacterium]